MKSAGLIVEELNGEVLIYDPTRHRAHCLEPLAAWVWQQCDGTRSIEQIARDLPSMQTQTFSNAQIAVESALHNLKNAYLVENFSLNTNSQNVTALMKRRQVLRHAGTAVLGAAAGIAVVSITAPAANAAASGSLPGGSSCTANNQCANGTCMGAPSGVCN